MTMPDERYQSVIITREFLQDLTNPGMFVGISEEVRDRARKCLEHFPAHGEMVRAAETAPDLFAESMDPLYRMLKKFEQDNK